MIALNGSHILVHLWLDFVYRKLGPYKSYSRTIQQNRSIGTLCIEWSVRKPDCSRLFGQFERSKNTKKKYVFTRLMTERQIHRTANKLERAISVYKAQLEEKSTASMSNSRPMSTYGRHQTESKARRWMLHSKTFGWFRRDTTHANIPRPHACSQSSKSTD